VAPAADLISVKVAGRDGSSDVSTILAAIQWVVSYRDAYNIRVLNLSLGTDSSQSYRVDPLNFAVERAWAAGITVVVAAGNLGPGGGSVTKPADDPFVVSVGAVDDRGTPGLGDDMLPDFSSRGPTIADGLAKPDLVAPGGRVLSLRSPGSTIDTQFPPATNGAYRRASGTSMAAGMVSGLAAIVLQMNPTMTPDRLKFALMETAAGAASFDRVAVGAGVPSAYRAATQAPDGLANVGLERSNGLGRLDLSRGSVLVQSDGLLPVTLGATSTAQLLLWQPTAFTTSTWNTLSWRLSPFAMTAWPGTEWAGKNWQGKNWQGKNWQGKNWQGASWYEQHDETADYGTGGDGSASYGAWG
jgi:serine protease AprX